MNQKKRTRLAIVMPRLGRYGGAEGFAWRLSGALAEAGYEVDFICARKEEDPPAEVKSIAVGRFGGCRFIKILWFAFASARLCKKNDYDLVIGLGNTVLQDILRIGGCPVRAFNRLSIRAWPQGFSRWYKAFRRSISPAGRAIAAIDDRRIPGAGTIIVAVSHLVRDILVQEYPEMDAERIQIIYNKPDLKRFSPVSAQQRKELRTKAGIAEGEVVITTAGTHFMLKGIRPLLMALALLPERFKLHVAGGRNPASYLRLAKKLGVDGRVKFLGRVEDMPSFYRTGDIFVLASFFDACSNAVLEALACGNKVISSATNGSSYFLPQKWIFPDAADHKHISKLIQEVEAEDVPGPFSWPDDIACGLDPYLELVKKELER